VTLDKLLKIKNTFSQGLEISLSRNDFRLAAD
jgi:hypothetical protein